MDCVHPVWFDTEAELEAEEVSDRAEDYDLFYKFGERP
jgi:hypothetical protein